MGYKLRQANYFVSDTPREGFKLHPAFISDGKERDYILLSAYEGCVYDISDSSYLLNDEQIADFTANTGDKLSSIANAKPCSGYTQRLTMPNARTLAHNRGEGWEQIYAATVAASQLLMAIEYASFNMQTAIGPGNCGQPTNNLNNSLNTGGTANFGNKSGATTDELTGSVTYRGEENIWDNIMMYLDGIFARYTKDNDHIYIYASDHGFSDWDSEQTYENTDLCVPRGNGYISAFGYSEKYDHLFIPSELKGNLIMPVGDTATTSSTDYDVDRVVLYGGGFNNGLAGGAFYFAASTTQISYNGYRNCRLVYIPKPKEEATE